MEIINKTTIIFNDNLKNVIKDFVNNRISKINFNTRSKDLEIIQDELRAYIDIEVFQKLTKVIKPTKPNYYTIFILILLHDFLNDFKTWDELNNVFIELNDEFIKNKDNKINFKTDKIKLIHKVLLSKEQDDYKTYFTCCCGQKNCSGDNLGIFKNYKGHRFMFGSKCITKTGINFISYCNKMTRDRDEYNLSIKFIITQPIKISKKYYDKSLEWVLENDKNYLIYLMSKGLFDKPEYNITKHIINKYYNLEHI
jgi:hypothetical protein